MNPNPLSAYATVRTEGALLPADILARIASADPALGGLDPASYHLDPSEKIGEATNRAWNRLQARWATFQAERSKLSPADTGTTATRERWLLPLFEELKFGRLQTASRVEIDGKSYAVSHAWQHVPIHLVGCQVDLDRRTVVGSAQRSSPHSVLQELLNRSAGHLWGVVSNGLRLRLLRDNISLTRQAYVEFDLEAMMAGEAYPDFVVLWLLLHQSRFEGDRPELCQLEKWSQAARTEGVRILDGLRDGVQTAIEQLGKGFLACPGNTTLRESLRNGALDKQEYYRQLLRLVYRLLFLFVAEDRDLLLVPTADSAAQKRYREHYATTRLRRLATTRAGSRHHDLYCGLRVVMDKLSGEGCPELALPALGSFLFSRRAIPDLTLCDIDNLHLLEAIRCLAVTYTGQNRRIVDYKNLGAEELGSVYESLLELHPDVNAQAATFTLKVAAGSERKKTGSYYTPSSLIACLLDSALEPVLNEAANRHDPEQAILNLKVVDPACGSGHFLIAAAHRIGKRLAAVRTGEEEPPPDAQRAAVRDVIGRCVYGVDLNAMAVELCKVSLWMEALDAGKPLSFLEHRIQCGNSLVGATPALLERGIPDDAFAVLPGDSAESVKKWKRTNRTEREARQSAQTRINFDEPWANLGRLAQNLAAIDAEADATIVGIHEKERRWQEAVSSSDYVSGKLLADAWCAAFLWRKESVTEFPITDDIYRQIEANPLGFAQHRPAMFCEIQRLCQQYQFFHWHLAFPEVFRTRTPVETQDAFTGWNGGFDVVLGNPPWERVKLQEKEWFSSRLPEIASQRDAKSREVLIDDLKTRMPALYLAFTDDVRRSGGESHFVRNSGRFPLNGRGDVNTYAIFAEAMTLLLDPNGRLGCILPSGIATDDTTKLFFSDLMSRRVLVSLYDFENRSKVFPGIDSRIKFCLLTVAGSARQATGGAAFVFFALDVSDLAEDSRQFRLSAEQIAILNPNTRTCPTLRSRRDAGILLNIYRHLPVLGVQSESTGWSCTYFKKMLDLDIHKAVIQPCDDVVEDGSVGVYEAKFLHHFDHRYSTFEGCGSEERASGDARPLAANEKANPSVFVKPRYSVTNTTFRSRMTGRPWANQWLISIRDKARATDERTAIIALRPYLPALDTAPTLFIHASAPEACCFVAAFSSFVLDYAARQKVGGINFGDYIVQQLPFPEKASFRTHSAIFGTTLQDWIVPRVLELAYTAFDMTAFAHSCGYQGEPFRWDENRRFTIRCELDALFLRLYGIGLDEVEYLLDTFPIVRRKDEGAHGEYRTKRVIVEIYNAMAEAERMGVEYQTPLEPPPGDPRCCYSAPEDLKGASV